MYASSRVDGALTGRLNAATDRESGYLIVSLSKLKNIRVGAIIQYSYYILNNSNTIKKSFCARFSGYATSVMAEMKDLQRLKVQTIELHCVMYSEMFGV